jgi:hypothetical protein
MTNHPNRARMQYRVTGNGYTAKFSDYKHAMDYAAWISSIEQSWCEVHHSSGIVGQYHKGKTTSEFQLHHDSAQMIAL